MSDPTKDLLNDVILERRPEFGGDLLAGTLNAVRRRRRQRILNSSLAAATTVIAIVAWLNTGTHLRETASVAVDPPVAEAQTGLMVSTQPLAIANRVATSAGTVETIRTAPAIAIVVNTRPGHELYQLLSDAELRMLLANRNPVILRQPDRPPQLLLDGRIIDQGVTLN